MPVSMRLSVSMVYLVFCLPLLALGQDQPAAEKSAADKSAEKQPADAKPADAPAKPAEKQPAVTKPADAPAKPADAPAKPDAAPAKSDAQPAPTADNKPNDTAPADGATAKADFAQALEQWKQLIGQMRDLKTEYEKSNGEQAVAMRQRWNELIAQGETLLDRLRETGSRAFLAAPNQDRQLSRFLVKLLLDDVQHDRYEQAYSLGTALADNGGDSAEVFDAAGVAAFCTNHFDQAEQYFKEAQSRGTLSEAAAKYEPLVTSYQELWKKESELRDKEAAAGEAQALPRVKLTTSKGEVIVELFENEAPDTVGNFVSLVESGFYNDKVFHRVLAGFMAQGGCPTGDGTGGPGYNIYCECTKPEARMHFRGTLSMAHAGKDTGGSQFFLTFVPTAHLNGHHTAFGRVVEGMEVLAKLQRIDPTQTGSKPAPDKIIKAEMLRKRNHEYAPKKVL